MSKHNLFLSLGDIIQITAPANLDIHNHIYLISYIDEEKIKLLDASFLDTPTEIEFTIRDGKLSDETIEEIGMINKALAKGFARQKNLVPDTWVDIYFGGAVPFVITGRIDTLVEDMIEIETYPEKKHIFIDFAYKGMPENLPIQKINIRSSPLSTSSPEFEGEELSPEIELATGPDLQRLIKEGDEIVFDEGEEFMTQIVEVREDEKRFGVDQQSEDLLDELLATIPTQQRTTQVMNSLHLMIERFKQLRQKYSIFDKYGNPEKPLIRGDDYKPLAETLFVLDKKLHWIVPVSLNKRKLYYGERADIEDVVALKQHVVRDQEFAIEQQYKQNIVAGDENKYIFLMRSMHPFLTPFAPPDRSHDILVQKEVGTNLEVIVNNLEDYYSTTFGLEKIAGRMKKKMSMVHNTRFVLESYTKGLSKLASIRQTPTKTTIERVSMTPNDTIDIRSFLMFPVPFVQYSKINLPMTSILERVNLHHVKLNYWQLLGKRTGVMVEEAGQVSSFLERIQDIRYGSTDEEGEDKYRHYLDLLVPSTLTIFKRMKALNIHSVTLLDILASLEPFMIYNSDLSFKSYRRMIRLIDTNVHTIKKKLVEYRHNNENFATIRYRVKPFTKSFAEISEFYNIANNPWWLHSTAEMLAEMLNIDGGRIVTITAAIADFDLYGAIDMSEITTQIQSVTQKLHEEKEHNTCKIYILAKRYIEIDEIESDNNEEIYFDKRYDITRYDIMDELKKKQLTMKKTEFMDFLVEHLRKLGVTEDNIEREAKALLIGKREVEDGDYAMLAQEDVQPKYYKRAGNSWVLDEELEGDWTDIFCNLQQKCLKMTETCNDNQINQTMIEKQLLEEIVHHFEDENNIERTQLQAQLNQNLIFYKRKLIHLLRLQKGAMLKYDIMKKNIGLDNVHPELVSSPYAELLELILMQGDFVKKQDDIKTFVARFCRLGEGGESPHWYYDAETNVPLLPTFMKLLADAFEEGRYNEVLEQLAAKQGRLSDAGDAIVDKHSGYVIKALDYVALEEYDEKGFRVISRDLLEKDIGDTLVQAVGERQFTSETAKMVYNVIRAMSKYLDIAIDSEIDFIVKNVTEILHKILPSEEVYNRITAKKKKAKSYKFAKNNHLLLLTLAFLTIVIQTMIPTIVTARTFPGCKRSFSGYPLEGENDTTFLTYIACILYNIRLEGSPWKTLKIRKKKGIDRNAFKKDNIQTLVKKLKFYLSKYILNREEIKEKIQEKKQYLLTYTEVGAIPIEHDITSWLTFLPPLRLVKISHARNVDSGFIRGLYANMKKGNQAQFGEISVIQGKIIHFSLAIIEAIQRAVNKEAPLLVNSIGEPFLENVCCNVGPKNTIKYFSEKESSIATHNIIVSELENTLSHIRYLAMAPFLYDPQDTRLPYPPLSNIFSEQTIYKAFIRYCRFNSGVILSSELQGVCLDNKSTFLITDTFEDKMEILKREGKHYTLEHLYQLLNIVERQNIVPMVLEREIVSARPRLENLLTSLEEKDIKHPLLDMFKEALDYLEIQGPEDTPIMSKINRYLRFTIKELEAKILEFIRGNSGFSGRQFANIEIILNTLGEWNLRGDGINMSMEEETDLFSGDVFKRNIINIADIFPEIIINSVDYDNVHIPVHWRLAQSHVADIQSIIRKEFDELTPFYGDEHLVEILKEVREKTSTALRIIDVVPLFIKTYSNTSILFGANVYKNLMHYYYLATLEEYMASKDTAVVLKKQESAGQIFGKNEGKAGRRIKMTEMDIIEGQLELVDKKIAQLLSRLLINFQRQKKQLNMNNTMIYARMLATRNKEKDKIIHTLKELSIQQREIENVLKNHRLGKWNVGLTRALYEYDEEHYEKERDIAEKDALMEMKLGKMGDDLEMTRDIYKLDLLEEEQADKASWAEAFNISDLPDDDDYGERDGDEEY